MTEQSERKREAGFEERGKEGEGEVGDGGWDTVVCQSSLVPSAAVSLCPVLHSVFVTGRSARSLQLARRLRSCCSHPSTNTVSVTPWSPRDRIPSRRSPRNVAYKRVSLLRPPGADSLVSSLIAPKRRSVTLLIPRVWCPTA